MKIKKKISFICVVFSVVLNIILSVTAIIYHNRASNLRAKNIRYDWYMTCAEKLICDYANIIENNYGFPNYFATQDGKDYFEARESVIKHNGFFARYITIENMK